MSNTAGMTGYSNGNSFGNGNSMSIRDLREPWWVRLMRPNQDRGNI